MSSASSVRSSKSVPAISTVLPLKRQRSTTWSYRACTCASCWNTRSTSSVGTRPFGCDRARTIHITSGTHSSGSSISAPAAPSSLAALSACTSNAIAHTDVNSTISSESCLRA